MSDANLKKRAALAKDIQAAADQMVAKLQELNALDLKIYQGIRAPDVLLGDSLISPARTVNSLRRYLAAKGLSWAYTLLDGPESVKPFAIEMAENATWAAKYSAGGIDKLI